VHLTHPAVTRNIQLLEQTLGAPLFERRGRRLVLTQMGRALVPRAKRLIEHADRVEREVGRIAERRLFDLRLGTVDSIVSYLFPKVVRPLRDAFPELAVKLVTARTADLLARLEADELDLAIIAWSGAPPAHRSRRVGPYAFGYYGREEVFPELSRVSDESELSRFPLIEIAALPGQPTLIGADSERYAIAGSLSSVKALVLGGFGVGGLLDFMLEPAESEQLVQADVPHDPECGVFVVASAHWTGEAQVAVEGELSGLLREVLQPTAPLPT